MITQATSLLKAVPIAFLIVAPLGASHAEAQASGQGQVQVSFAYRAGAPAEQIYAELKRTARHACESIGTKPLRQYLSERACTDAIVEAGVARIGRSDLTLFHHGRIQTADASDRG